MKSLMDSYRCYTAHMYLIKLDVSDTCIPHGIPAVLPVGRGRGFGSSAARFI